METSQRVADERDERERHDAAQTRKALKTERRQAQLEARRRYEAAQVRRQRLAWGGGILAAAFVVGGLAFWLTRPAAAPGGLPGPLGGRDIAQDVNTLVGQSAPAFTLPDSTGRQLAVTPGQGRPLVLVFHMGIT